MRVRRHGWLVALALVGSCVTRTDLGADPTVVPFVLGARATCAHDAAGLFHCIGDGTDVRLGIDLASLDETCGSAPCTSVFEQEQNAEIRDAAFFDDGGCFGVGDGVVCAGRNDLGQGGMPPRDTNVTATLRYADATFHPLDVDAGVAHVCALTDTQQVLCWGLGAHGELGVAPASLDDCGAASAAQANRLAIAVGATIRCTATPRLVPGITDAVGLATTSFGTCVLRATGELRCFGGNAHAELGLPTTSGTIVAPTRVDVDDVVAIDAGAENLCALRRDGSLLCTGANDAGQLGDDADDADCGGTPCVPGLRPVAIGRLEDFALGDRTLYVLDAGLGLAARGSDAHGQLGDGAAATELCATAPCSRSFVRPRFPRHVLAVRAGGEHACALLTDGRAFCFGSGSSGETGSSFHEDAEAPVELVLP